MADSKLNIAVAAYEVSFLKSWTHYEEKLTEWVRQAASRSQMLIFPEYAAMELSSLFDPEIYSSLDRQLEALQSLTKDFCDFHARLARQFNVYLIAGSIPVAIEPKRYHNRAYFFAPDGDYGFQDKILMTRFENEQWMISGGHELKVFDTRFGKVAINICYDAEFPTLTHQQVAAGAKLIVVPSCTDTIAGFERVRVSCRARALENQCYVAHSSLIGNASWSPAIDINVGGAGIFSPVDRGYPDNGIMQQSALNQPGWIYEALDLSALDNVRNTGQVLNYRDWDDAALPTVTQQKLL